MTEQDRLRYLRIALRIFGVIFVLGLTPRAGRVEPRAT